MPRRALHPCAAQGCVALVQSGAYCIAHRPALKRYDDRATASQRGYGATWRRLRMMIMARNPICADPFGTHAERYEVVSATDVDHIVPKPEGRDEESNLQALCHSCHSRKTRAYQISME